MNIKKKLIIDLFLTLLLVAVMLYSITGNLLHEIIGIIILVGYLLHMAINRKYFLSISKIIKGNKNVSTVKRLHNILTVVLNTLLFIAVVLMIISSVAISNILYSNFGFDFGNYGIFKQIHIVCANVMSIIIIIHIFIHTKIIKNVLSQKIKCLKNSKAFDIAVRIFAIALIVVQIRNSVVMISNNKRHNMSDTPHKHSKVINKKSQYTQNEMTNIEATTGEDTENKEEVISNSTENNLDEEITTPPEATEPPISLDEFLSQLNCTGCPRNCSLLNPQCGKGHYQAQIATEEYNETYGTSY